jgi:hypothetical protein
MPKRQRDTVSAQVKGTACTGCKTVGSAYVGSNPTPATDITPGQTPSHRAVHPGGGSGLRTVGSACAGSNPAPPPPAATATDLHVCGQGPTASGRLHAARSGRMPVVVPNACRRSSRDQPCRTAGCQRFATGQALHLTGLENHYGVQACLRNRTFQCRLTTSKNEPDLLSAKSGLIPVAMGADGGDTRFMAAMCG